MFLNQLHPSFQHISFSENLKTHDTMVLLDFGSYFSAVAVFRKSENRICYKMLLFSCVCAADVVFRTSENDLCLYIGGHFLICV